MGGASPQGDTNYETSANAEYSRLRRADPRIAARVHAALGNARVVLNVGAGAGSYEPTDRAVTAVEPSASMRAQRPPGAAPAIDAVAEALPFQDNAFDAAMAMVTVHQWPDAARGVRELRRVSRGPVVILTFDPERMARFWLAEYAPKLLAHESTRFPTLDQLAGWLGAGTTYEPIPIPLDCTDGFMEALYGKPERFLDWRVRAAQSSWQFIDTITRGHALEHLRYDLKQGVWDARYGALRTQPELQGALTLVVHPGQPLA